VSEGEIGPEESNRKKFVSENGQKWAHRFGQKKKCNSASELERGILGKERDLDTVPKAMPQNDYRLGDRNEGNVDFREVGKVR